MVLKRIFTNEEDIDWGAVYDENLPRIFRYIWFKTGNLALAEDLTASTFEKAWKNRDSFKITAGDVQNWLFGITKRVIADYYRTRKLEISLDHFSAQISSESGLEEDVQRSQEITCLTSAFLQLSELERELLAMKYGAEFTNRKIGKLTGKTESNVGTILYRAVNKLRLIIGENNER